MGLAHLAEAEHPDSPKINRVREVLRQKVAARKLVIVRGDSRFPVPVVEVEGPFGCCISCGLILGVDKLLNGHLSLQRVGDSADDIISAIQRHPTEQYSVWLRETEERSVEVSTGEGSGAAVLETTDVVSVEPNLRIRPQDRIAGRQRLTYGVGAR